LPVVGKAKFVGGVPVEFGRVKVVEGVPVGLLVDALF
jgi:hypothetical protein